MSIRDAVRAVVDGILAGDILGTFDRYYADDVVMSENGTDERAGKATFPALLGLEASRARADSLADQALASLQDFGPEADFLRRLAGAVTRRES